MWQVAPHMGEVLTQVWLKSVKKSVSYWTNKGMYKREVEKIYWGSHKPTKKCAMKMKEQKTDTRIKMFLMKGSGL